MHVEFRCPSSLRPHLAPPVLARSVVPGWFAKMPAQVAAAIAHTTTSTARTNPAIVRSMQCGFLLRTPTNIIVEPGPQLRWNWSIGDASVRSLGRAVVQLCDPMFFDGRPDWSPDHFVLTIVNHWLIQIPEGWNLALIHPFHREDVPFQVVPTVHRREECRDRFIHVPTLWRDPDFVGVIPRGTPFAMGVLLPSEEVDFSIEDMSSQEAERLGIGPDESLTPSVLLQPKRRRSVPISQPEVRASLVQRP